MMEEKATVIAINGDQITVQSIIKSTCSTCHQIDSCGSGQISKAISHKTLTTHVHCNKSVVIGDQVILGIPESDILQTAWQVYMWPIFGLIFFSGIAQWLLSNHYLAHEVLAVAIGFLGGYLGFKLAGYSQKQCNDFDWLAPKLLSVLPKTIAVKQIQTK